MRQSKLFAVAVLLLGLIHANPHNKACSIKNGNIYGSNCVPQVNTHQNQVEVVENSVYDELLELDLQVKKVQKEYLNNIGMTLMNLAEENGEDSASIEKNLYDFFDIQLYSKIYVGSNKQIFEMIFDTGSSWVWVQHQQCQHCMQNPHHFDSRQSTTFQQISDQLSTLQYGKGTVFGYDCLDQVCLSRDSELGNGCMLNYKFKSIVSQMDLRGLAGAGIIGLSPSAKMGSQLFIPSLYQQSAIKKNMFSIYIDANGQSKIIMGGYKLHKYAKGPIQWHQLTSDSYWQLPLDSLVIGDFVYQPSVQYLIADSGTSLNMLPDEDFNNIFDHFFKDKYQCHVSPNTLTICQCTKEQHESIPDINVLIEGKKYTINRDQWFERSASDGKCVIKFMHNPSKQFMILGLNFFTNYYTVFDYEQLRIGFAPSKIQGAPPSRSFMRWLLSSDKQLQQLESSETPLYIGSSSFNVSSLVQNLLMCIFGGIISLTVYFIYNKNQIKKQSDYQLNENDCEHQHIQNLVKVDEQNDEQILSQL